LHDTPRSSSSKWHSYESKEIWGKEDRSCGGQFGESDKIMVSNAGRTEWIGEEASKQVGETNKALEDLRRVNKLLADVRSELISSQKSLTELEERRTSIMSYMTSLTDAEIEVETETQA